MNDSLSFPRRPSFGCDYWLCHSEGFRVDTPSGRLGIVEEVRFRSRHDRPDELVVRGGIFGRRVVNVPVAQVEQVEPRTRRIALAGDEERSHVDLLAQLRSRVRGRKTKTA